jgi:hypothetical protein
VSSAARALSAMAEVAKVGACRKTDPFEDHQLSVIFVVGPAAARPESACFFTRGGGKSHRFQWRRSSLKSSGPSDMNGAGPDPARHPDRTCGARSGVRQLRIKDSRAPSHSHARQRCEKG